MVRWGTIVRPLEVTFPEDGSLDGYLLVHGMGPHSCLVSGGGEHTAVPESSIYGMGSRVGSGICGMAFLVVTEICS